MIVYTLYIKTHNITGLKYLGQTIQDPFSYYGSGKYWRYHLQKHGYDISTIILGRYDTSEELQKEGLYYSKLWNVVKSDEWANLVEEKGEKKDGNANPMWGKKHKLKSKELQRKKAIGRPNPMLGRLHSIKTRQSMRKGSKKRWGKRFIGVRKRKFKTCEKFQSRFCINGKGIHLGDFNTEIEAAIVYDIAAVKHFGYPINFLN